MAFGSGTAVLCVPGVVFVFVLLCVAYGDDGRNVGAVVVGCRVGCVWL